MTRINPDFIRVIRGSSSHGNKSRLRRVLQVDPHPIPRGGSKLNCQRVLELIHAYVDRELDPIQAADVERHLDQCEECNLNYRGQIALRSTLQDDSFYYRAPANLKTRITSSIKKETEASQPAHTANSSEVTSLV